MVGVSGVIVNLGVLGVLADLFELQINLASAIAIETSINTNFLMNEVWTFRDHEKGQQGLARRWLQFHVVSFFGAALQWVIFVLMNMFWLWFLRQNGTSPSAVIEPNQSWVAVYITQPIFEPPEVGNLKYFSQLIGICVAMFWNYFANFYWTWNMQKSEDFDG